MGVLHINLAITITINIDAMPTGTIPTNVSLILVGPDGTATFDASGTTIGATYTAPTTSVAGSYVFTKTFTTPGNWTIILANGTSSTSYRELYKRNINLLQGDAAFGEQVTFPSDL